MIICRGHHVGRALVRDSDRQHNHHPPGVSVPQAGPGLGLQASQAASRHRQEEEGEGEMLSRSTVGASGEGYGALMT